MSGRILLIDDDDSLRRVTEYNLVAAGFEVVTAASGQEGLAEFNDSEPDLVVTDVELGDMNGLELLAEFKEKSPDTPVIVITAYGSIDMAVKSLQRLKILQRGNFFSISIIILALGILLTGTIAIDAYLSNLSATIRSAGKTRFVLFSFAFCISFLASSILSGSTSELPIS